MADLVVLPRVTVRQAPVEAAWVVQCAPADAPAFAAAGLTLPTEMLRSRSGEGWRALHLAPDEWLVLGGSTALFDRLAGIAAPHSLVDVSSRGLAIDIVGPDAALLVNTGCPLDLGSAFPVGACTRTLFGKATVLLEKMPDSCIRMHYWRSFHAYVTGLALAAAGDLD